MLKFIIKPTRFFISAAFLLACLVSCDDYTQDDYQELVVIEAYAIANQPLPEVRVSKTLPTDMAYNFADAGLTGANVRIVLLGEDGTDEQVFVYEPSAKGMYTAEDQQHRVLPRRSYRVDINFNNRPEVLHAQTTVPDDFELFSEVPDTVLYQSDVPLELSILPFERTQNQAYFIFSTSVIDPSEERLTSLYKTILEEDDDADIEDYYETETTPISEGNFELNSDGARTVDYPWILVAFYGDNKVITHSIDTNLSDLLNSRDAQMGEGNELLPPGEIPNLRYHVEGGIGIFGSMASDTVQTFFKRQAGM